MSDKEQPVHDGQRLAAVPEIGIHASERVPPETCRTLMEHFDELKLVGGRDNNTDADRVKWNEFLDQLLQMLRDLKPFEVQKLILEYKNMLNEHEEMNEQNLDGCFEHMKSSGRLQGMFVLQSCLRLIGRKDLFKRVAEMAKRTWEGPDLKIPYCSDDQSTTLGRLEIPRGAGCFMIHIKCRATDIVEHLLDKKKKLARLFQVSEDLICICTVFPEASFWVCVLAPSLVVQKFEKVWQQDDFKEYLHSILIDNVTFPAVKEEGEQADIEMGAASSATLSSEFQMEPASKRMKMEDPEESFQPKPTTSAEIHRPLKEKKPYLEFSQDEILSILKKGISEGAYDKLKDKFFFESDISMWNFSFLAGMGLT